MSMQPAKAEIEEIEMTLANLQDLHRLSEKRVTIALADMMKTINDSLIAKNNNQQHSSYAHNAQAVTPARQQNPYRTSASNSNCFYCLEEGHMKDVCPHRNKHAEKGWIVIDMQGRHTLPNGGRVSLGAGSTSARVEAMNAALVASTSQSIMGQPGILQLSQSTGRITQQDIEDELEKFDLDDLAQFLITCSGGGVSISDTPEKGFRRVQ
ncbi:hypothetical protein M413DRAFT_23577 [Hebeloma cylindrosporum]|uniref:CCHC-type domain-containing protein n=1 Tax=Hebeloma cylindrosporum TaxID=76867 RepID=A0A0C2YBY3_HEBCY|nr:hypothetical protein M413DRAFT_23577 [Hebeloma cylindrosporum h7]